MLLERWINDISKAVHELELNITESMTLPINNALFSLIQSPLWDQEFKTFRLAVSEARENVAWIIYDEVFDPLSNGLEFHHEGKLNAVEWQYGFDMWELDEDFTPWDCPYSDTTLTHEAPIACEITEQILSKLRSFDPYYDMLLTTKPSEINKLKQSLVDDIEIVYLDQKDQPVKQLWEMARMNEYNISELRCIFGHRYLGHGDESKSYVIARNKLGPIGLLALWNAPDNNKNKDFYWSISYISVSPSYRNEGLAKRMTEVALDKANERGRFISRTEPTDIGRQVLYHSLSDLGAKHITPFVEPALDRYAQILSNKPEWQAMSKDKRFQVMNNMLNEIRKHIEPEERMHRFNSVDDDAIVTINSKIERLLSAMTKGHFQASDLKVS